MTIEYIEKEIEKYYNEYVKNNISNKLYYYTTMDYIKNQLGLSYRYIEFDQIIYDNKSLKDILEEDKFIDNFDDIIEINLSQQVMPSFTIKYLSKILKKNDITSKDCIKEFLMFMLLKRKIDELKDSLDNKSSEKIKKDDYKTIISKIDGIIEIQRKNFIYLHLKYLLEKQFPFSNDKDVVFVKDNDYNKDKNNCGTRYINSKYRNYISFLETRKETKTISEFIKEDFKNNVDTLFYRGQANSNWNIDTSIHRSNLMVNEHKMFHKIISLRPNDFVNEKTDYEKLIKMQHYGLPTRLLDITRNPLIALFFACNDEPNHDGIVFVLKNDNGVILNFDDEKFECLLKLVKTDGTDICSKCEKIKDCKILNECYFVEGVASNPRISNQCGDFIFYGFDNETYSSTLPNEILKKYFSKFIIIDKSIKKELIEQLKEINIHSGVVYPDLSHMTDYIRNTFDLDKKDNNSEELNSKSNERKNNDIDENKTIDSKIESNLGHNEVNTSIDENKMIDYCKGHKTQLQKVFSQNKISLHDLKTIIDNCYNPEDSQYDNAFIEDKIKKILIECHYSLLDRDKIFDKIKLDDDIKSGGNVKSDDKS